MQAQTHSARDTLLALSAGRCVTQLAQNLCEKDWVWIGERAETYRLQPLLHSIISQQPDWDIPQDVRTSCSKTHRDFVFRSLIMQQALVEIGRLLDAHHIAYVALKGASLSLEFYAQPTLRPMRDLDILVAPEKAEQAYELLKKAGFARYPGKADHGMEYAHHLPLLTNDKAVLVELHHRIAPREWSGSLPLGDQLLTNARRISFQGHEISMAHPTDTAIHLIVHACLQHLFDNGPNLLSDMDALNQSGLVDWDKVAHFAKQHDLEQSLALIKALFAQVSGKTLGPAATASHVPASIIEQTADLMTQDPEEHWQRHLLRRRRSLWQRLSEGVGRALKPTHKDLVEIARKDVKGISALRYYPQWLWAKSRVYIGAEFQRDLDQQAKTDAQLEDWLKLPSLNDKP